MNLLVQVQYSMGRVSSLLLFSSAHTWNEYVWPIGFTLFLMEERCVERKSSLCWQGDDVNQRTEFNQD
jgi:hypothetical protein